MCETGRCVDRRVRGLYTAAPPPNPTQAILDALELAGVGERLSFLELQRRAQAQRKVRWALRMRQDVAGASALDAEGLLARHL